MRDVCKSGAVVAAVVAVLEKQNLNGNKGLSTTRKHDVVVEEEEKEAMEEVKDRNKTRSCSGAAKNRRAASGAAATAASFESAVDDFNSVAEDVGKICATTGPPKRVKTESRGPNVFRPVEFAVATAPRGLVGRRDARGCSSDSDGEGSDSTSGGEEEEEEDTSEEEDDSDEERELVISEGLATITEEISGALSYPDQENDSSLEEESTLKGHNQVWSENSNQGSTSDLSTSTSSERRSNLRDSSTRCNSDFQWFHKERSSPSPPSKMDEVPLSKPPLNHHHQQQQQQQRAQRTPRREKTAPGSLDRRRHLASARHERDQKARSTHVPKSPPRLEDFVPSCQGWCCNNPHEYCYENFQRRHERLDPQRYGSNPMLETHQHPRFLERGSHPDIYGDCGRYRYEYQCCSYHVTPPCCYHGDRSYHWTPPPYPKPGEQDEKFRKLQYERDNLQLQVQVLTEQIEAQSDKITDLEKSLQERKLQLSDTEDKLQREMLSRSSLETQKLELMSIMSELKLQQAALERENLELRSSHYNNNTEMKKPPILPRMTSHSSQPQLTSTPHQQSSNQQLNVRMSPSPSPVTVQSNSPRRPELSTSPVSLELQHSKTPPSTYKRQIDIQYGSLPRQQFLANGSNGVDSNANPSGGAKKGVAFADTEKVIDENSITSPGSPNISFNKSKGIKKIFGKMKRSGSGNLEDIPGIGDFQRGGVRATAAARLGWSEPQIVTKPDKPFAEWDSENICDWLQDLGLDGYITEAKRWVVSGQQLQEASISDIEKELNIKNPLHRKKLQLALIDTQENGSSDPYLREAGKLDTAWVLRWLDDAGLPQHKENFLINRVDGRVLHRLTMDDLALLHVSSMLHVASIKRGIQVLRENNYEPACLQRRSLPEDPHDPTPKQISLWTTHRVMEWLRAVDLAEYAPNLRGAGVHGGLMVLEPKFNAELLASLLSIPPGKTLLRRHLNTHFKELLGKDIIQEKREIEAMMGYIPLTPSSKLKIAKKSQFSLKRKKSKGEADYGDLVCPLNPDKTGELTGSTLNSSVGTMKMENLEEEVAFHRDEYKFTRSLPASVGNSPVPQRHV